MKVGPIFVMALGWAFAPAVSEAQSPQRNMQDWDHFVSASAVANLCVGAKAHNNRTFTMDYLSSLARVAQFIGERSPGKTQAEIAAIIKRVSDQIVKDTQAAVAAHGCSWANLRPSLSFYKSHSDKGMFVGIDLPWRPDAKIIAQIESTVRLPRDSYPIVRYDRYYAGIYANGRRVVRGVYLDPMFEQDFSVPPPGRVPPPSVHIVEEIELPVVYDGGCGSIAVSFDLSAAEAPRASCGDPG